MSIWRKWSLAVFQGYILFWPLVTLLLLHICPEMSNSALLYLPRPSPPSTGPLNRARQKAGMLKLLKCFHCFCQVFLFNTHMHMHTHTNTCTHTDTWTHILPCKLTCAHTCIQMHSHINMHAHTHTHKTPLWLGWDSSFVIVIVFCCV